MGYHFRLVAKVPSNEWFDSKFDQQSLVIWPQMQPMTSKMQPMTTKTATKKRLNNHKHIETPLSWPVLPLLTSGSLGGRRRFALRTSGLAAGSGLGIEGARKGTGDREDWRPGRHAIFAFFPDSESRNRREILFAWILRYYSCEKMGEKSLLRQSEQSRVGMGAIAGVTGPQYKLIEGGHFLLFF